MPIKTTTVDTRSVGSMQQFFLIFAVLLISLAEARVRVTFNRFRRSYSRDGLKKLKYGHAEYFSFGRFQPPDAIDKAMPRSSSYFKHHTTKDGRDGYYCSTRLGGDWVLAESKQVAKSCNPAEVLAAYLDDENQKKWNEDKVQDIACAILKDMHKYDKERASKTLYIDLLITKELGKYVKVWKIIERDSDHFSLDTERLGDEFTDAQTVREDITNEIHAEREYNKLTRIQQMEVLGYSFKEIGAVVGLNPDYLRNKQGMSARKGSKQHD